MSTSCDALLIFCRAPSLGCVKTRLAAKLGAPLTLQLYRAMLRDCFDLGRALSPDAATAAYYTPNDGFENSDLNELWGGESFPQRGNDLGARMLNALSDARARGFERTIIIGSDAPDLPLDYLRRAFELLHQNAIVVGPSADGGFVLIGASRPVSGTIFDGITWSRTDVCARLTENLRAQKLSFSRLETRHDVDEIEDVDALRLRLQSSESLVARATREILREL